MKEAAEFLRRHLMLILFGILIGLQAVTVVELRRISWLVDNNAPCGVTTSHPCRVMIVPQPY